MECLPRAQHCVRAGSVDVNKTHRERGAMSTGALLIACDGPKAGFPLIAPTCNHAFSFSHQS